MTYHSDYMRKLKTAIEKFRFRERKYECDDNNENWKKVNIQRPIVTVEDLLDAFTLRATTERQMRDLIREMCNLLEPPGCYKSHCPHNTTYSFCQCSLNKVPGRCKEHREYVKRKKLREQKNNKE